MTNQENSFPQSAQEANEEALPQKPSSTQENLPTLDEEQLEAVAGGGCFSCLKPKTLPDGIVRSDSGKRILSFNEAHAIFKKDHPNPADPLKYTLEGYRLNGKTVAIKTDWKPDQNLAGTPGHRSQG